jgi:hypothetical protein
MPTCAKCKQQKDQSQLRTYHLVLRNNVRPNSILAGVDKINLCFSCDGARTTNIVRYLEQ